MTADCAGLASSTATLPCAASSAAACFWVESQTLTRRSNLEVVRSVSSPDPAASSDAACSCEGVCIGALAAARWTGAAM